MNLLLFDTREERKQLSADDPRVEHIRDVLRMTQGDEFFVGVVNGPKGKAKILEDSDAGMVLEIVWEETVDPVLPVTLLVGLPRPQTARRVLQDCTTMGVGRIMFFQAEKGEPSYASSKLWQTEEWRRHLMKGAEQAFSTTIPEVMHCENLGECLEGLGDGQRVALDNYEADSGLSGVLAESDRYVLAVGSERGWSGSERDMLRENGFALAHLGERVLKTETACVSALTLIGAKLGVY